ncbi:E3 ubiquitin-protein ligase TTC3-like isoform X2 [Palaemon carinicauda]|uniref:E3 ubiquitin-protein ligase TTC3-like isoform X2 n=1 Tax=Palaemon carinicauda TaxID=392227 RepID=UPI0035B68E21
MTSTHTPNFSLTENGVCLLYDVCHKDTITMQVIFMESSHELCYIRLSDGRHVSPVVALLKGPTSKNCLVGSVIGVKEARLESLDFQRKNTSQKDIYLKDKDLFLLVITNYKLLVNSSEVGRKLGSVNISSTYKDSIRHIIPILKKYDKDFKYIEKNYTKGQQEAKKLREQGNNHFHEHNYELALVFYDMAKGNDLYDYRLWTNSSRAYFQLQQYESAMEEAIVAIKLNPYEGKAYLRAGQAALKLGRYVEAKEIGNSGLILCKDTKELQSLIAETRKLQEDKLVEIKENEELNNKNKKALVQILNDNLPGEEILDPDVMEIYECRYQQLRVKIITKNQNAIVDEEIKKLKEKGKLPKNGKAASDENSKEPKKIREDKHIEEELRNQEASLEMSTRSRNLYHQTLKNARRCYEDKNFTEAIEMYGKALAYATPSGDMKAKHGISCVLELQAIQFFVAAAKIHENKNIMEGMLIMKWFLYDSDIYLGHVASFYFFALAYEKICMNKAALIPCQEGLKRNDQKPIKWPGSDDIFPEGDPDEVKIKIINLYKRCEVPFDEDKTISVWKSLPVMASNIEELDKIQKFPEKRQFVSRFILKELEELYISRGALKGKAMNIKLKPRAKCRFKNCISTQGGHPFAREEIYETNPDFKGFVDVLCEEHCTVTYHPCCWKAHKEELEDQFGKMSEKDFFGTQCETPDCTGKIHKINIYDETAALKHEIVGNKRDKNSATPVKQKKKKDKKKSQPSKPYQDAKDKKRSQQESMSEDISPIEETVSTPTNASTPHGSANDSKDSTKQKVQVPVAPLPIDPESLDKVAVVIKPTVDEDPVAPKKSAKKKKKKNKKQKEVIQPDLLGDPLEADKSNKNDYVARLRLLKQQREAQESGAQNVPSSTENGHIGSFNISQWLDPDNPFYLPQHLQDNPEELERILQTKMISSTSPNLENNTISTLLEFVYEWLKFEGPMSINDERLRQYVAENFPQEALDHVNHCGGIKQFLMQSIDFAMIDEIICVRDHVVRAQESIRKTVSERMMSSKFLISDGLKAKKFSHLLEDGKSTCSSSSSISGLVASGVSSHNSRTTSESTNPISKPQKVESVKVDSIKHSTTNKRSESLLAALDTFTNDLKTDSYILSPKKKSTMEGLSGLDSFEIPSSAVLKSKSKIIEVPNSYLSEDEEKECEDEDEETLYSMLQKAVPSSPKIVPISKQTQPIKADRKPEPENHEDISTPCQNGLDHSVEDDQEDDEMEDEEIEEQEEEFSDVEEDDSEGVILREEIEQLKESMKMLTDQNQKLNDKLIQVKSSTSIEISSLKQKVEEQEAKRKDLESEKHGLAVARESEARKFKAEMSRMQEEVKLFQSRHTSLELKYERSVDHRNELDAKLIEEQEVCNQLREEVKNLQESLSSSSRRAHEAEVKYLCIKKDLTESHLNRTIERLTTEVVRLRQLLQHASEDSIPDRPTLSRSIIAWDECIKSLRESKAVFLEEAKKLLNMVNQGRPLNALPPGDLSIPAIPDINIAPLLIIVPNPKKQMVQPCAFDYASGSPAHLTPPPTMSAYPLEQQMGPVTLPGPPGFEAQKPIGLPKIPPALAAYTGGAIPKGNLVSSPKSVIVTATDGVATQKYPDSHKLFIGKLPWESTEMDIKPIMIGNHVINVQAKETKKPTRPLNLAVGGSSNAVSEPLIKSGPSAYGLSDISHNATSEANKSVVCSLSSPTVHQSITTTITKPKFQNLSTSSSVGTIGTLPPKLVRPQPRQPTNGKGGAQSVASTAASVKEDTAAYKRLIEVCKQRIGKEYSSPEICSALREVRMKNSNSLSGMSVDHIVDSVKQRLRARRPASGQATVAPWAGITQGMGGKSSVPEWQGLPSGEIPPEEQCSICLDALNLCPTLQLQCQHVFHEKCISGWLKRQSNCPNCRTYALMDDEYPSLKH